MVEAVDGDRDNGDVDHREKEVAQRVTQQNVSEIERKAYLI